MIYLTLVGLVALWLTDKHLTIFFSNRSSVDDLRKEIEKIVEFDAEQIDEFNIRVTAAETRLNALEQEVNSLSVKEGFR